MLSLTAVKTEPSSLLLNEIAIQCTMYIGRLLWAKVVQARTFSHPLRMDYQNK